MNKASVRKPKRLSVFYQYMVSHFSLVLLFCAVIGVLLLNFSTTQYNGQMLENSRQRGQAVLRDLNSQISTMEKISYSIMSDVRYYPANVFGNPYYEYSMLKNFNCYSGASVLTRRYFLLYRGNPDKVYYSINADDDTTGATYTTDILRQQLQIGKTQSRLFDELLQLKRYSVVKANDSGLFLMCFPLHLESSQVEAVLCFCVDEEQLISRAQMVAGDEEPFILSTGDMVLVRGDIPRDGVTVECAPEGSTLMLTRSVKTKTMLDSLLHQTPLALYGLVLIAVILLTTGVAAYRHSKPIRSLNEMIQGSEENEAQKHRNELMNIEAKLRRIIDQSDDYHVQVTKQKDVLREQTLHLLLCGEYYENMESLLQRLDIPTVDYHNAIAVVHLPPSTPEAECRALACRIDELSTPQMRFFSCMDKEKPFVDVVMCLKQPSLQRDAQEMLGNLLEAENYPVVMGCGSVYESFSSLAASYAEARDNVTGQTRKVSVMSSEENREAFRKILALVRMGHEGAALQSLNEYVAESQRQSESLMWQRCMFADLLHMLVDLAHEMDIDIYPNQISAIMTAQSMEQLRHGMEGLVVFICERNVTPEKEMEESSLIQRVMDYIVAHGCDNDLSLEKIADEFEITSSYLSRLVRSSTGFGYKDYVLRLRMNMARESLMKGMTTAETCAKCGYVNVSHFIKTFKQYCGVTPAAFQRGEEDVKTEEE